MPRFIVFTFLISLHTIGGVSDPVPYPIECYASGNKNIPNTPYKTWNFRNVPFPQPWKSSLLERETTKTTTKAGNGEPEVAPPSIDAVQEAFMHVMGLSAQLGSWFSGVQKASGDVLDAMLKSGPEYCKQAKKTKEEAEKKKDEGEGNQGEGEAKSEIECPAEEKPPEEQENPPTGSPTPAPTATPTEAGWPEPPKKPPSQTDVPEDIRFAVGALYDAMERTHALATIMVKEQNQAKDLAKDAKAGYEKDKVNIDKEVVKKKEPMDALKKIYDDAEKARKDKEEEIKQLQAKIDAKEEGANEEELLKKQKELVPLFPKEIEAKQKYDEAKDSHDAAVAEQAKADETIKELAKGEEIKTDEFDKCLEGLKAALDKILEVFREVDPVAAPPAPSEDVNKKKEEGSLLALYTQPTAVAINIGPVNTALNDALTKLDEAKKEAAKNGETFQAALTAVWEKRNKDFDVKFATNTEDDILYEALQNRKLISHATGNVLTPDDVESEAILSGFVEPGRYLRAIYGVSIEHIDEKDHLDGVPSANSLIHLHELAIHNKMYKQTRTKDIELSVISATNVELDAARRPKLQITDSFRQREDIYTVAFDPDEGIPKLDPAEIIDLLEEEYFNA